MNKCLKTVLLLGIIFLLAISSIACFQSPWNYSNWFNFNPPFFGFTFLFGIAFAFLPIIIAVVRQSKSIVGIILLNILAGWTVIGWIIALVWAISGESKKPNS
jgi:hypothetical protein